MTIDFEKGELWLIDKPYEWTSFDVVQKLKYAVRNFTGEKKFKIGHAGTLDPLATGLLLVCVGKMTKSIDKLQAEKKVYTGIITLGATTPSYDLETPIQDTFDVSSITENEIKKAANSFLGEIDQYAPLYSAKKIDGKRAYEIARAGEEKELKPHRVTIFKFDIEKIEMPHVHFRIECSKGTYIRSLAHDLGKKLNNGAHLRELRRTQSGEYSVENAYKLKEILGQLGVDVQDFDETSQRKFRRTS